MNRLHRTLAAALVLGVFGCSDSPPAGGDEDTGTRADLGVDTGPRDAGGSDIGPADTGVDVPAAEDRVDAGDDVTDAGATDGATDGSTDGASDGSAVDGSADGSADGGDAGPSCTVNGDCAGDAGAGVCDPDARRCVECLDHESTCGPGRFCMNRRCTPGCRRNDDCAGLSDAGALRCDTTRNVCVGCTQHSDCQPGSVCASGMCVAGCNDTQACPGGESCCGGRCIPSSTDMNNCGGCRVTCTAPNGTATCSGGMCRVADCNTGLADCDSNVGNGCEVDTRSDLFNCGACGFTCRSGAFSTPACTQGRCTITCDDGYADCDNDPSNGCEISLRSDVMHCGQCPTRCASAANATPLCNNGRCQLQCSAGFDNCDGNAANGCEANLSSSNTCGRCGNVCDAQNPVCSIPTGSTTPGCTSGCRAGETRCGNTCVTVATAVDHCGACNAPCPERANAVRSCAGGACGFTCNAGFADCDANPANGCEVNLATNAAHCGQCRRACAPANATGVCSSSSCGIGTCNGGFANCNGNAGDGCEVNTSSTLGNCGACGRTCSLPNATAACVSSACAVGTCNTGFANCDGSAATGCETALTGPLGTPSVVARFAPAGSGSDQTVTEDVSVAFGANDDVYVLSYADKIIVFDRDGRYLRNYPARGWTTAWDIAVDRASGEMWLVDPNNSTVYHLGATGLPLQTWTSGTGSRGIAFARGEVYVPDFSSANVRVYGPTGTLLRTVASAGLTGARGLAVDSAGNMYVANAGNNTLRVIGPTGALVRSFAVGTGPSDVAIDECRQIVYVLHESGDQWIAYRFDGTRLFAVGTAGGTSHAGIAVDSTGRVAVAHNHGTGRITLIFR